MSVESNGDFVVLKTFCFGIARRVSISLNNFIRSESSSVQLLGFALSSLFVRLGEKKAKQKVSETATTETPVYWKQ